MLLQDVAASFHQTTVSTVNFNSFQYSPPFQQYEIPLIPAVVISKVLLLQSNIMVGYVPSHGNHFSYVYPGSNYTEAAATCSAAQQHTNCPVDLFCSAVLPAVLN
jgi:hypothetical protein